MKITWYGHAAFAVEGRLDSADSRKVILDPYNYPSCGGYLPIDEAADVVSVSHDNPRYHSDVSAIRGDPVVIEALDLPPEGREACGILFEACRVYENDRGEGPNAMVRFRLEDVCVAHMGDLGHALAGDSLDFLRQTQVLLALAGGPPTLSLAALVDVVEATRPAIVVPMHFKTPKVNLDLLPLSSFLEAFARYPVLRPGDSAFQLTASELPSKTTVVVLEHAR